MTGGELDDADVEALRDATQGKTTGESRREMMREQPD